MTTFKAAFELGSLDRSRWKTLNAVVGTGSSFTAAPREVPRRLGVVPVRKVSFELADGSTVESDVGEARVRIHGIDTVTLVVFGELGAPTLLGAHSLEWLMLGVDPVNERLLPGAGAAGQRRAALGGSM